MDFRALFLGGFPKRTLSLTILFSAAVASGLTGCAKRSSDLGHLPKVTGPAVDAGSMNTGEVKSVALSNGAELLLYKFDRDGGRVYFPVEGTFSSDAYSKLLSSIASKPAAEQQAMVSKKIKAISKQVRNNKGISFSQIEEAAYFTFLLPYQEDVTQALKELKLNTTEILLNPITTHRAALQEAKSFKPSEEGLAPLPANSRQSNEGFSGLKAMRVLEFKKQAEADIGGGVEVDGSSVKLGITDTGITYNHKTFLSKKTPGQNRIQFMGDYTREGRVYFPPNAKFIAKVNPEGGEEDLLLDVEVLMTPRLPKLPLANELAALEGLPVKVSAELRKVLLTTGNGAKFGLLFEDSLQSENDTVDLNGNENTDDSFPMILIPGKTPDEDVVYIDPSGTADFRNSEPLSDWNRSSTKKMVPFDSEKLGFSLRTDELATKGGESVQVRSASFVGFDPGNHGTHVAGIAAGRKTIANDNDDTLAKGVAPEAPIYMQRVCANNGGCKATEAFIELVMKQGVEVVNMSLGGLSPFNDGYGVQETIINRLTTFHKALFMIAAGNSGPGRQTVASPSVARLALSIGATATPGLIQRQYQWPGGSGLSSAEELDRDFLFFFSSRGPTAAGGFKPNLVAPGTALSAVRLNTSPGERGAMDVYWGTSMATPAATGAYALFLDAIKKYNDKNPKNQLPTDVQTLKQVFIESARAFDVSRFNPKTGAVSMGRYTWIDQGTGMVDLVAAWKNLFEVRDQELPTAVTLDGKPVELDYQIVIPTKGPNGIPYDGSRTVEQMGPVFGTGITLDFRGTETLRPVYVARRIPENLASGPHAGTLKSELLQTQDVFVLKTVIDGSNQEWVRAGVLDQLNCATSPVTDELSVQGRGVEVGTSIDGTGIVIPNQESTLFICIDRDMIASRLPAGDHGALIYAYRKVGSQVAATPSFIVPLYVTVPHKTLNDSTAYEVQSTVESFGVSRNYIDVPKGTSVLKLTLEVPTPKLTEEGRVAPGEVCSSVELMLLQGGNTAAPEISRKAARVLNCASNGTPILDEKRRTLTLTRLNPTPGIWDVHVFGTVKFAHSKYKLRVDYFTGETNVKKIAGDLTALNGSLTWTTKAGSLAIFPDQEKSALTLDGLSASKEAQIQKGEKLVIESPLGSFRSYPEEAKSVAVATGGSTGNDLDVVLFECDTGVTSVDDASCESVGRSAGPTDEERVSFTPKKDKVYAVQVEGFDVSKNDGKFTSTELIGFTPESGEVKINAAGSVYTVSYALSADSLAKSKLAKSALFLDGRYFISGALAIRAADWSNLATVPVEIKSK